MSHGGDPIYPSEDAFQRDVLDNPSHNFYRDTFDFHSLFGDMAVAQERDAAKARVQSLEEQVKILTAMVNDLGGPTESFKALVQAEVPPPRTKQDDRNQIMFQEYATANNGWYVMGKVELRPSDTFKFSDKARWFHYAKADPMLYQPALQPSSAVIEVAKRLCVERRLAVAEEETDQRERLESGWANEPPLARFRTSEPMHVSEESFLARETDSQTAITSLLMGRLNLL